SVSLIAGLTLKATLYGSERQKIFERVRSWVTTMRPMGRRPFSVAVGLVVNVNS
ncbi:uncharacterized protein METZ01_LOCUS259692, partial [marine metagenome]